MTVTHVLELTDEELKVIHSFLVFMDACRFATAGKPATLKLDHGPTVDKAFQSALAKTTELMKA